MPGARKLLVVADDCQSCGACCMAEGKDDDVYVDMTEADARRMTQAFRQSAVVDRRVETGDPWLSLRTKKDPQGNCVCIALGGTIGTQVACSIYERRPEGCREFQPGTECCHRARREAGLE